MKKQRSTSGSRRIESSSGASRSAPSRPARVLVIDRTPRWIESVEACTLQDAPVQAFLCKSLADARACAGDGAVDLLVLHPKMPDGDALDLAHELIQNQPHLQTLVVTAKPTIEEARRVVRLGSHEYLTDVDDAVALQRAVRGALERGLKSRRQSHRLGRLRRLCGKLEKANHEVSEQVDSLCKDLLSAYQELAGQMNHVVQTTEYSSLIRDELDLEHLIRRTLEHLIDKAGPTNAAIFLPSTIDEYTVGGYVNYDCADDMGELVLSHLADYLAPKVAEAGTVERLKDDHAMAEVFDGDIDLLTGRELIAVPCMHQDETLAVVVAFRGLDESYDDAFLEVCRSIGPILGAALGRVIRIHHRAVEPEVGPDELPF